ncbi:MAG: glycosyltransferase family 4 protein [Minisyncoccota bacterium]
MKTLFLIFHGRFPSEKAASLFAAKSCEAFAERGYRVTLLVPRRLGVNKRDPHEFYGVHKNFRVVYLPTVDLFRVPVFSRVAFHVSLCVFAVSTLVYLMVRSGRSDVVYSNEHLPLLLASYVRENTFYEVHDMPERNHAFYALLFRRIKGLIITNRWKLEHIAKTFMLLSTKLFYEPNAVDVSDFDLTITKEEARTKLGITSQAPIVLYTGHLYSWKGVDTLARAAGILDSRASVYIVGGTNEDVARFKKEFGGIPNLHIVGYRPHKEIPVWQKAADAVVLPNTAREDISKYYTSPMKLFEYMASRRPIVATNIPSVQEIVNNLNAIMVIPDDQEAMARGVIEALENTNLVGEITERAYQDVELHTWDKRARRILDFVEKKN